MATRVIVVGGGLAGLSAAHTVIEHGGRVVMLDKNSFMGGNSTKATSGINGALTRQQQRLGIKDSVDAFLKDTAESATGGKSADPTAHQKVLVGNSAAGVEWLASRFNLDLSIVGQLGGHSFPRTHRGTERFPGMTVTYALMEKLEEIAKEKPTVAQIHLKARVTKLLTQNGAVVGVEYTNANGQPLKEYGPVVVATGGFGADFGDDGLVKKLRPDLLDMPTTNGDHCTGDGMKMGIDIGAATVDMNMVQVHPTGLVHPDDPNAKVKFLAAEALRGTGALLIDKEGDRFCNELGRRDYVSGEMFKRKMGPYRLVLNSKASKEIEWHCKHYQGRGLMKFFKTGADLAADMGISTDKLADTFEKYNEVAKSNSDPFGKKFFHNTPFVLDDYFYVAIVCPVVHYCMGGLKITPDAEVQDEKGKVIPGFFAAGEVTGGVHGNNRLGGSSLQDCVVYGRVAGDTAARYLLSSALDALSGGAGPAGRLGAIARQLGIATTVTTPGVQTTVSLDGSRLNLEVKWDGAGAAPTVTSSAAPAAAAPAAAAAAAPAAAAPKELKEYTLADVAQHNKETDCWVVVNGQVLDVTSFLKDHPGGKQAILLFAGKDATAEFNMLHKPDVVAKYAPQSIIGTCSEKGPASH